MKADEQSVNLTPFSHDSCARSVIFPLLHQDTYSKQLITLPMVRANFENSFWSLTTIWKRRNWSSVVMFLSPGGQTGVKFPVQFLKNGWTKKPLLILLVAQLEIRIISKNEPNRCTLQGVTATIMYRTKWPQTRNTAHSEPKLTFWTT